MNKRLDLSSIIVKSKSAYVDASFVDFPYISNIIHVNKPLYYNFQTDSAISRDALRAIDAFDIKSAILHLGCILASEDESLSMVTKNYRNDLRMIKNITDRFNESDCCPISLDEIKIPAIVQCCQQKFEFINLIKTQINKNLCPMCKAEINIKDIIVIKNENFNQIVPLPSNKGVVLKGIIKEALKMPNPKILVYSDYTMAMVAPVCNDLGLNYKEIKGNFTAIEKTLNDYKFGNLKLIALSEEYNGSGLNLQCTTHLIITSYMNNETFNQLVGRAQRPGRKGPLIVYKILFDNETF